MTSHGPDPAPAEVATEPEAEAEAQPESEDFLSPAASDQAEPSRAPVEVRPYGVVEPAHGSSGLRRYAPAAAAAVAGVTAVVVWALGRRRR